MKTVGKIFREGLANDIKDSVESNSSTFLLTYSNLTSNRLSNLRMNLKKAGARFALTKNKIAKLTLNESDFKTLANRVADQTAFVWTDEDSVEVSKILVKFSEECETFSVQGAVLEGREIEQADVKKLSELPSREVLLAMLLSTMQAPVSRLMGALNAKSRDLLSILKQYSEQKGGN